MNGHVNNMVWLHGGTPDHGRAQDIRRLRSRGHRHEIDYDGTSRTRRDRAHLTCAFPPASIHQRGGSRSRRSGRCGPSIGESGRLRSAIATAPFQDRLQVDRPPVRLAANASRRPPREGQRQLAGHPGLHARLARRAARRPGRMSRVARWPGVSRSLDRPRCRRRPAGSPAPIVVHRRRRCRHGLRVLLAQQQKCRRGASPAHRRLAQRFARSTAGHTIANRPEAAEAKVPNAQVASRKRWIARRLSRPVSVLNRPRGRGPRRYAGRGGRSMPRVITSSPARYTEQFVHQRRRKNVECPRMIRVRPTP